MFFMRENRPYCHSNLLYLKYRKLLFDRYTGDFEFYVIRTILSRTSVQQQTTKQKYLLICAPNDLINCLRWKVSFKKTLYQQN